MSNAGPKTVASRVTLTLGLLSTSGSLLPIHNNEEKRETKTFLVTPCEHESRVEQFYVPTDCSCVPKGESKGYKSGELLRGKDVDGKTVVLDPDELAEIRGSDLPKNVLDLLVCDSAEFEMNAWPNGNAYWLEPERVDPGYAALVTLVVDRSRALYGRMRLRSEHLYRLLPAPWGGLVLQECLAPNEMWRYEAPSFEIKERDVTMARAFADAVTEPFDAEAAKSKTAEKMRAALETLTGTEVVVKMEVAKKTDDLTSALEMALAAAQAAKEAKAS